MRVHALVLNFLLSSLVSDAILYDVHDPTGWVINLPDVATAGNLSNGSSVDSYFTKPKSPCDISDAVPCLQHVGCKWTGQRCEVRIAWLHVMKTASSSGTTLAHHANASLPKTAHIPSCMTKSDPEDMTARVEDLRDRHLVLDFFEYKYPVDTWFQNVFRYSTNPGAHRGITEDEWNDFKGYWVTILRQPEERTSSAWHHFGRGQGDMFKFQRNVQGQQAKMLTQGETAAASVLCERTGGGLFPSSAPCDTSPAPNVSVAIQRVREFAFVGILEQFDLSICLFHAMFGSECLAVEFLNVRPTGYHESEAAQEAELKQLKEHPDPWDTPVYEAALKRFKGDLARFNVNNDTCKVICPHGPF
jgi:hypothetical protein